jgi:succinate-semialdehyde dehydrogenase/glutarate-semialdehyde dehydrogenase
MVLKSPGETPFTAAALAELSVRAGVPPGVFNVVTCLKNTPDIGSLLTTSPTIKKVSFTGSTRVGKLLMGQASGTLKKLSFELGGNAPFIVFDDADLEKAVAGAVACKFRSSGQTCVCANRIYVQRRIYDAFVDAFVAEVEKFKMGPGYSDGVTHGPLIHDRAVAKVKEHIDDAVKKGGKVVLGGHAVPELGSSNFFQLTIVRDMTNDMLAAHDETFGPLAPIFPFDTEEEVVRLANDTEVGLAGYFYSQDVARCYRLAEAIEVGMIGINTGCGRSVPSPQSKADSSQTRFGCRHALRRREGVGLWARREQIRRRGVPDHQGCHHWGHGRAAPRSLTAPCVAF